MKNNLRKHVIFFALVGILGILFSLYLGNYSKNQLIRYGKYSIGRIEDIYISYSSGRRIIYSYHVNGKKYSNSTHYIDKYSTVDNYIIKFSSRNPSFSRLIWNIYVPDNFPTPPPEGWEKLPRELFEGLYEIDIKRIMEQHDLEVEGYDFK
jgi:hypothetical protein